VRISRTIDNVHLLNLCSVMMDGDIFSKKALWSMKMRASPHIRSVLEYSAIEYGAVRAKVRVGRSSC